MQIPSLHSIFKPPFVFPLPAHISPLCLQDAVGNMGGWESHLHLLLHLYLFKVGHQAIHSISGLASHALPHRAMPHNSHLLHSQLWCPGLHLSCGPSTELTSSCSPSGPQTNLCQSQSHLLAPATQRDSQHIQLGIPQPGTPPFP